MGVFSLWNSLSRIYMFPFLKIYCTSINFKNPFCYKERKFSIIHSKNTSNDFSVVTETIVKLRLYNIQRGIKKEQKDQKSTCDQH